MEALKGFEIPITSLQIGTHNFEYIVQNDFLKAFEAAYDRGKFEVKILFEKKHSMLEVDFNINGYIETACDRCMEDIKLPITNTRTLIFKYAEEAREEEEIVYLKMGQTEVNLSKFIYEFIMLAIPLKKVKDCELDDYKDCNQKILDVLDDISVEEEAEESALSKALKEINLNQNK